MIDIIENISKGIVSVLRNGSKNSAATKLDVIMQHEQIP